MLKTSIAAFIISVVQLGEGFHMPTLGQRRVSPRPVSLSPREDENDAPPPSLTPDERQAEVLKAMGMRYDPKLRRYVRGTPTPKGMEVFLQFRVLGAASSK